MKKFAAVALGVAFAMLVSVLGLAAPASAADVTATFTATATAEATATATATAAAYAGTDVTAKIILQDEAVTIPESVQKRLWVTPTTAEFARYGTVVSGQTAAQATVTREVKAYKSLIAQTKGKIAKAKALAKYYKKKNPTKARTWAKRAVALTKTLNTILVSWKYRPLIGLKNLCYLNRGFDGNLNAVPYRHCVSGGEIVWVGYDPVNNVMRIVYFGTPGAGRKGCLNVISFVIPPGVPDASVIVLVRSLIGLKLEVTVQVAVTVHLRVSGEMRQDGKICDTDDKYVTDTKYKSVTEVVEDHKAKEAMEIAQQRVKLNVELRRQLTREVTAQVTDEVSATMTLSCSTPPPPPPHTNPLAEYFIGEHAVDPGGTMPVFGRAKAFDGATVTLGSPVVSPSSLGGVYNWRSVSTERDGVTPCEVGWTCYQGYFRAMAEGNGLLSGTATDNRGGTFTTQPLQFTVVFIIHPET